MTIQDTGKELFYTSLFKQNQEKMLLIDPATLEIVDCNLSACSYYGYPYEVMLGMKISDLNVLKKEQIDAEIQLASQESRNHFYFRHKLANGELRDVEAHSTPIELDGKNLLLSVIRDITDIKKSRDMTMAESIKLEETVAERTRQLEALNDQLMELNAKLEETNSLNTAILECLPGYLYVYDEAGHLVKWNKKHEEMTGYSSEELAEMTLDKWFEGEDATRVMEAVSMVFQTGYGEVEGHLLIKGGKKRLIRSNGVKFTVGGKNYFAGVGLDISKERQDEENLRESEKKFRRAIEGAPVPIMLHAEDGEVLGISRTWTEITGYTLEEIPTTGIWAERAYGVKSGEVNRVIDSSYNLNFKEHVGEFSIRTKSGNICLWDFYSSYVGKLEDGRKLALSIAIDITAKKSLEADLAREKNFLETTLLSVGDGVISCENSGKVLFLNKAAEQLTGWELKEAKGKNIEEIFHVVNEFTRESNENIIQKVLESKEAHEMAADSILISRTGVERAVEDSVAPIIDDDGEIMGAVLVFRDFTSKKEKLSQIEFLSYHDQLTGLYNRRFYEEELERLDTERNLPLSIIMGDVNGLKLINDSFGHMMGDDLLKKVAESIKKGCRGGEIIARYGGDEFVILLPKTDHASAEEIIKRIKEVTAEEKLEPVSVSISFGSGTKVSQDEDIAEIFKKAEEHMYQKKLSESPKTKSDTIKAIIRTLKEKEFHEEFQTERIAELCGIMGSAIGLNEHKVAVLKQMAMLHDIGKIAIEDYIFTKPDKLTEDEREEVNRHSEVGYRILSTVNDTSEMAEYVLYHHERWNGSGYPKGLKAEEIPIESRILAIIDAYESMISERSYREPLSQQEVLNELEKNAGTQFDPDLVFIFIKKVLGKK